MKPGEPDLLLTTMAQALCSLLDYVEDRPDDATADDDVKALEDASFLLLQVPEAEIPRLVALLGEKRSSEIGLIE